MLTNDADHSSTTDKPGKQWRPFLRAVLFGLGGRQRTSAMTIVLTAKVGGAGVEWPARP